MTSAIRSAASGNAVLLAVGDGTCRFELRSTAPSIQKIELTTLNRITRLEAQDFYISCQAGLELSDLYHELARQKLHFPFLGPDSPGTVGGMIASGHVMSGHDFYRISRWILALRVATADGDIIKSGAVTYKSVAGYDLSKIFCGSFGTLGIIVEASLRLYPIGAGPYGKDLGPVQVKKPILGHISELKPPTNRAEEISQRIKRSFDPKGTFPAIIGWNA